MQEFFGPEDWPEVKPDGFNMSVDVWAYTKINKNPVLAYFNYKDMLWYSDKGEKLTEVLKWREKL